MNNLSIKTQGVKGGKPQYKEKIGYVSVFLGHSEDFISIDAYEGRGENYKPREQQNIQIFQNGKLLFCGNKYELFEILQGK